MARFLRYGQEAVGHIAAARSLGEIHSIVSRFPAQAPSSGAVLYSGLIGPSSSTLRAEPLAVEFARQSNVSIINNTPRAAFLSRPDVVDQIKSTVTTLKVNEGHTTEEAHSIAVDFLYGNSKQPSHSPTSVEGCLWGTASKEFAESLHGPVHVMGTSASPDRVLGRVEIPAALNNQRIDMLGGQSIPGLREIFQREGVAPILPLVQKPCIEAVQKGLFEGPGGQGLVLPKSFYASFGLNSDQFSIVIPPIAGLRPINPFQPPGVTQSSPATPEPGKTTPDPSKSTPEPGKTTSTSDMSKQVAGLLAAYQSGDIQAAQKTMQRLADSDSSHHMQAQASTTVTQATSQASVSKPQPTTTQPSTQQQADPSTSQGTGTPRR